LVCSGRAASEAACVPGGAHARLGTSWLLGTAGLAALLGYAVFSRLGAEVIAATTAVAAGAILAMLADTMIPEAFEQAHDFAGLITVAGFLVAFVLTKLGG
jgi:ZIP family zinc transporter